VAVFGQAMGPGDSASGASFRGRAIRLGSVSGQVIRFSPSLKLPVVAGRELRRSSVVRVYSHSRLQSFETCPLKYKFRYIDRVETPIEETVEMFVGSRVHDALEKLYKDLELEKLNALDDLLEFYRAEWQKQWNTGVKITRDGMTEKNYFNYGAKCLRNYYDRYKPFNQSLTLATELRLSFALDDQEEYKMTGIVDRAARRADGTYEIHDYKTGRTLPAQQELDRDRQLALYQIGLGRQWPDVERVELIWHYVRYDTTMTSTRTPEQLEALRQATIEGIDRIEAEEEFAPCKGAHCDWCEFQPVCPLWKHIVAVGALPPAQFAADDGVKLANEISHTKRQREQLEQRYEELKELIAEFCREQKITVVAGSGVRVTVREVEQIKLPEKNEPEREALERLLRKLDRWEYVAGLDVHELKRVLKGRLWPEDVLRQLEPYATAETGTQVTVRRTKEKEEEDA
jgi:putative RecB family exonuclease